MNIGNTLRAVRYELNYTQAQVADLTGLAQNVISEMESNKRSISLDTIELLCEKLNISKEAFIIKAIFEQHVEDPTKQRLLREIKPFVNQLADLYK